MNPEEKDHLIARLVDKITQNFDPERIILFGSQAWGNAGPHSDFDLCVIKKTTDARALAREIDGALFPREAAVDVIVYDPKYVERKQQQGDPFIQDILTNGRVLYER